MREWVATGKTRKEAEWYKILCLHGQKPKIKKTKKGYEVSIDVEWG